jgi:hypothetical protein
MRSTLKTSITVKIDVAAIVRWIVVAIVFLHQ